MRLPSRQLSVVAVFLTYVFAEQEPSVPDVHACDGSACDRGTEHVDGAHERIKYTAKDNTHIENDLEENQEVQEPKTDESEFAVSPDHHSGTFDTGEDGAGFLEFELEYLENGGYKIISSKLDTGKQTFFQEMSPPTEEGKEIEQTIESAADFIDTSKHKDEPETQPNPKSRGVYEFPVLSRLDPKNIGDVVEVELEEGVMYKRITRAVQPPVFEIPNFLSEEECDLIIESAKKSGLNISNLFGEDVYEQFQENVPLANISRVSHQTWLDASNLDNVFFDRLQRRVAKLTELPVSLIKRAESIQVVSYAPGGHYHAHLDSIDGSYELPCCFQTQCESSALTPQWSECCRLCRYITVLYYLNDPEEGGETAFPVADKPDSYVEEKFIHVEDQDWYNLSYYCYNSSLVVKPKRGTAVMWYNHFTDKKTGYLGLADKRSHHGGCDLKKGSKWIANTWISGSTFEDRFKPSIFYSDPV